jgi:tetratricopeptide (TPR) repeat protein
LTAAALAVTALTLAATSLFIGWESAYARADAYTRDGAYERAREVFTRISFYRDAQDRVREIDDGRAREHAASEARRLEEYEAAAARRRQEDRYREGFAYFRGGDYLRALMILQEFTGWHPGIPDLLAASAEEIYRLGVSEYRYGSVERAAYYFSHTAAIHDTEAYLTLIRAQTGELYDGRALLDLIGFEDAGDILLGSDAWLSSFLGQSVSHDWGLGGRWSDGAGHFIEYTRRDGEMWCRLNIPRGEGASYRIRDGSQWHGSDEAGWSRSWDIAIESRDRIRLYNHENGRTYTMDRR